MFSLYWPSVFEASAEFMLEKCTIDDKPSSTTVNGDGGSQLLEKRASSMELSTAIRETQIALNLFLNNRFELAKEKMEPWLAAMIATIMSIFLSAKTSMYHALGYTTVHYIKAMMTCEPSDVEAAVAECKSACNVCNSQRRQSSMAGSMASTVTKFVRVNSNKLQLTHEEMHAELCYAECLLQRALLTFIQDESLSSFVKGALKIRNCYNSYRECQRYLQHADWTGKDPMLRGHFESGVKMGLGAFNLLISSLPARILRLLEFVGFSGDKGLGLNHLETGADMQDSLRSPLCALVLLTWNLVAVYLFGTGHGDIKLCRRLLGPLLQRYPKGALILYFAGRLHVVTADLNKGIQYLDESIAAQTEWRQFHHLCYWELMFAHAYLGHWTLASSFAMKLYKENKWSRCTYGYMAAVFLFAQQEKNLTPTELETMNKLFSGTPGLKQRIAGKSLPIEKFAAAKANRFKRKSTLYLPHYELLYLWNGFQILSNSEELLKPILIEAEDALEKARVQQRTTGEDDDVCLCLMFKAMCLKHLQSPFQAEQCLREITESSNLSSDSSYLAPNAWIELAMLSLDDGKTDNAKRCLMKAKSFKGYLLESRLHFRAHSLGEKVSYSPDTPLVPSPSSTTNTGNPSAIIRTPTQNRNNNNNNNANKPMVK